MEGLRLLWAHFRLLIYFLILSPAVQVWSLLSAFGPRLLPIPSMSDFPELPARYSCPLQMLFGLISFFLPCPH